MSKSPRKGLDSKGHGGVRSLWPQDVGVNIDVQASEFAAGSVDRVLQPAIDALLQALAEDGFLVSISRSSRAPEGRHAAFSCAATRDETIWRYLEERGRPVDDGVSQDEPAEGQGAS